MEKIGKVKEIKLKNGKLNFKLVFNKKGISVLKKLEKRKLNKLFTIGYKILKDVTLRKAKKLKKIYEEKIIKV